MIIAIVIIVSNEWLIIRCIQSHVWFEQNKTRDYLKKKKKNPSEMIIEIEIGLASSRERDANKIGWILYIQLFFHCTFCIKSHFCLFDEITQLTVNMHTHTQNQTRKKTAKKRKSIFCTDNFQFLNNNNNENSIFLHTKFTQFTN